MFVSFSHRFLPFASNAGIFEGLFIPARAVERGLRSRAATGLTGLNAGRHKRVILDRAIMTRVIKGFAVGATMTQTLLCYRAKPDASYSILLA